MIIFLLYLSRCHVSLARNGIVLELARSSPPYLFSGVLLGRIHRIYVVVLDGTQLPGTLKESTVGTHTTWIRSKIIIQSQHKTADWVPLATTEEEKSILSSFCSFGFF